MIYKNSDRDWISNIDELMDEDDASLADEECERKWVLNEIVVDGYYDPCRIDQTDVAGLMILQGITSEEDAYLHNFTEEDEKRLADVLGDNWNNLDGYSKVVYHVIMNTASLPRWRRPYPPAEEYMQSLK
jgi:hypothetical protein